MRVLGLAAALAMAPVAAHAAPIIVTGNATGASATATGDLTLIGNLLTLILTNTSPFDARITGVGFDLIAGDSNGNDGLDGFTGNNPGNFVFGDGDLGNVPQFDAAVLDFGWTTGPSGNFNGGSPNNGIPPLSSLTFTATGVFPALTDAQLASGLYVRFQQVGANGDGSDVGGGETRVPEPATLLLLSGGLVAAVRMRRRLHA